MFDLWLRNPKVYLREGLAEGFRKFTWDYPFALLAHTEVMSWFRMASIGYTDVQVMLIDHTGAAVYNPFSRYDQPSAVYPTWHAYEDGMDVLDYLVENPPGADLKLCTSKDVAPCMRPVFGQKNIIVIRGFRNFTEEEVNRRNEIVEQLLGYEAAFDVKFFVSGFKSMGPLFQSGLSSGDLKPINIHQSSAGYIIWLPNGKQLGGDKVRDKRYADWFRLLGYEQSQMLDAKDCLKFTLASMNWGRRYFNHTAPFVYRGNRGKRKLPRHLVEIDDTSFVLPTARRRVMRNLGLKPTELDKFACDTCIYHNCCTLYREGSICTVKGSDAVGLAEEFGTRNADRIIGALGKLVERQVERLEEAEAEEKMSGERDPEVTKMYKTVFDQGVKLAKLIDPKLSPGVNVNVGVNNNTVQVASSEPRQLVATLMAEFEAAGFERHEITSDMIKGALTNMASTGNSMRDAVYTTKAIEGKVV